MKNIIVVLSLLMIVLGAVGMAFILFVDVQLAAETLHMFVRVCISMMVGGFLVLAILMGVNTQRS